MHLAGVISKIGTKSIDRLVEGLSGFKNYEKLGCYTC